MRINDDITAKETEKKAKGAAARKAGSGIRSLFALDLKRNEEILIDHQKELRDLKDEIYKAGDALDEDPSMANFKTYRTLLTQLSRKVLTSAYKVETQTSSISARCHEIITVIDREADALYRLIISEQKDRIKITSKIAELKGLVIDFLL